MTSENIKNQKAIKTNAELFLSLTCRMTSENIKKETIKTNAEFFLSLVCRMTSENTEKGTSQNKCWAVSPAYHSYVSGGIVAHAVSALGWG